MRILHVLAPARFGGLERVVRGLAIGQHRRGHQVSVAAIGVRDPIEHPLLARLTTAGVACEIVHASGRDYWRQLRILTGILRRLEPDVVHSHGYHADVLCVIAARREGIRVVSTAHGFTGGPFRNRAYEWIQTLAYRRFDVVVAVSDPLRKDLVEAGVPGRLVRVVKNAWSAGASSGRVEARRHLNLPPDGTHVGWVGRMTHEKGLDIAVRAFSQVGSGEISLSLIGDGPERAHGERLIEQLGCTAPVSWHGEVENAGQWLSAFDVLMISSRTEGTPMTLFEAMASGVPVVATSVGGIPDVLTEGSGLLVPPEDAGALASALRTLLAEPGRAMEVARRARARLESEYAEGPWLDTHEGLYTGL